MGFDVGCEHAGGGPGRFGADGALIDDGDAAFAAAMKFAGDGETDDTAADDQMVECCDVRHCFNDNKPDGLEKTGACSRWRLLVCYYE